MRWCQSLQTLGCPTLPRTLACLVVSLAGLAGRDVQLGWKEGPTPERRAEDGNWQGERGWVCISNFVSFLTRTFE